MSETPRRRGLLGLAALTAIVVLLVDVTIELGVATSVSYIVVVCLAYGAGSPRAVWTVAFACSLLSLVGWIASPAGGEPWKVFANRGLSLGAIWLTAFLCQRVLELVRQQAEQLATAGRTAAELAEQRQVELRRSQALAVVMNDLRIEREKVVASEAKYRDLYDNSPEFYVSVDAETSAVENCNQTLADALQMTKEEILGQPIFQLYAPECLADVERAFEQFQKTGIVKNAELMLRRNDGTDIDVILNVSSVRDETGHVIRSRSVCRDISDRKEAERQIHSYAAELERSNAELDSFAYIASHDLKEPLRGIRNFSTFLLEDYGDLVDEAGRTKLETLGKLSDRMASLLDDLLKYSRVGRGQLDLTDVCVEHVVGHAIESLGRFIEERSARIVVQPDLPRVRANETQVRQIFENLISNGIKYNDAESPRVEIGADDDGTLWVKDDGIGIPVEHRDTVFRIFKRLHDRDAYGGGSGAGLTIVKKIIECYGGQITIESHTEQGTTVSFTLPTAGDV